MNTKSYEHMLSYVIISQSVKGVYSVREMVNSGCIQTNKH